MFFAEGVPASMLPVPSNQQGSSGLHPVAGVGQSTTPAMIPDGRPPTPETEASNSLLEPANDNANATVGSIDPRILIIARAIGRQIAQKQLDALQLANDKKDDDEG